MHARATALALLVALAPVAATTVSYAQQQADDPTTKAARARFQEGVDFFDKGQYEQARAAFLQAYALKRHPAVLVNLAQSCLKSNHALEAAKYYQQYLKEAQNLTPAQKADAEKGLAESRAKLGRLDVQAAQGSEITVDNERVGFAPLSEPLDVEAGAHAIRTKAPDGSISEQRITVTAGQTLPVKFGTVVANPPPTNPPPTNPPPTNPPVDNPPPTNPPPTNPPPGVGAPIDNTNPPPPPDTGPSKPLNPTPFWIGAGVSGGVMVVGFVLGGIFAGLKDSANSKYLENQAKIRAAGGGNGICTTTPPYSSNTNFRSACATLLDNQSAVNTDATVANIGVAVGIIGGAAAIGFGTVALIATMKNKRAATTGQPLIVTPWLGGEARGLSVAGSF